MDDERSTARRVRENAAADAGVARRGEDTPALDGEEVERFHGDATAAPQGEGVDAPGVNGGRCREQADVGVHRDGARHHFRAHG